MVDYFRKGVHRGFDFFMTPFCFYEALGVLKRKYPPHKGEEKKAKYFDAFGHLIALLENKEIQLDEVPLSAVARI
jgi:hypothetical protein